MSIVCPVRRRQVTIALMNRGENMEIPSAKSSPRFVVVVPTIGGVGVKGINGSSGLYSSTLEVLGSTTELEVSQTLSLPLSLLFSLSISSWIRHLPFSKASGSSPLRKVYISWFSSISLTINRRFSPSTIASHTLAKVT